MSRAEWNERYRSGNLPWDRGVPDPHLVAFVAQGVVTPTRALELGCGGGTNAIWLASRGVAVTAVDVAPLAIELSRRRAAEAGAQVAFGVADVLRDPIEGGPFDFAFDRGCFHSLGEAAERARFAERVASELQTGGHWLSLIGSADAPPRDTGPPMRSARDIVAAWEPHFEIRRLEATRFRPNDPDSAPLWRCLARKRG